MTTPFERFDAAAGAAACQTLSALGSGLVQAGAFSLVTGTGAVPILAGMGALLAANYACNWDPDGPSPIVPTDPSGECRKFASLMNIELLQNGPTGAYIATDVVEIYSIAYDRPATGTASIWVIDYESALIGRQTTEATWGTTENGFTYGWRNLPEGDPTCEKPAPEAPPVPDLPPTTYTDPESGCSINVEFKGLITGAGGVPDFVFKMTPGAETRASGGVIGGCNFSPTIYAGNPGGPGEPPTIGPWNPDWDLPDAPNGPWLAFLREVFAGLASELVAGQISKLFESPYQGITYELKSVCEKDADGNPVQVIVEAEVPTLYFNDAVLRRLDALVPLLQGQKDFKQPICNDRPKREGEWRTISFRSEKTSPFGKSRLRKRFRYLSLSGIGLDQLVSYWESFSFEAGPVIVSHIGASWGEPKVWAATADEGKRVIRHAAGEAGIDPDQVGEWQISGSRSTRLGMSGTMKIDTTGGYFWITERDGSDSRPIVAR